ncbi:MAG: YkgJ family cysteine cluster protein [Candidatus Omnitrophica bacterium]|nr:YkgJ family cysteine cluster protein [Candidatus Omnitrophota bacterium]
MFSDFPQLVPQKICLSCQGCCRFKEAQSLWRPRIALEELAANEHKKDLAEALGKDGYIKTVKEQGQNRCTFLNLGTNKCGVYAGRPFECRLYPFLLTRFGKNGRVAVSVHLSCPHVQQSRYSAEFEKHAGVLKAYLSGEESARFLQNNPALVGDYSEYHDEIEELFTLEFFQRETPEPA